MKRHLLSLAALLMMILLALGSADTGTDTGGGSQGSSDTGPPTRLKADAQGVAEDYVKQFLKYPHDAEFPWLSTSTTGNDEAGYWVQGKVRAKNAFGAELTHEWKVNVTMKDDTWHLVYCEIGGEPVYVDDETTEALERLASAVENQETVSTGEKAQPPKPKPPAKQPRTIPKRKEYEFRTWTDNTGAHTIDAKFVSYAVGKVTIEKKDGSKTTLPMQRLSDADQKWVRQQFKR